jgi:hypothetical protein
MKKTVMREKIVAVQEKMLKSIKGGSGYIYAGARDGDPDPPPDGGS